jgi:hypothetical protein
MRDRPSASSPGFRRTVENWLDANPELLVLNRLSRAGGRKDWYLITNIDGLDVILARSRPSDCLTVFAQPHLPHRVIAGDPSAAVLALALLEKTDEAVFGQLVDGDPQLRDAFEAVPGDEDWVTEWLSDRPSAPVAFGPYPPFMDPNPAVAIDGLVPNEDGSLTMGVY